MQWISIPVQCCFAHSIVTGSYFFCERIWINLVFDVLQMFA